MSFVTIKSPGVPSLMRSTKLEPVINDATLRVNWSLLSVQDSHPFFLDQERHSQFKTLMDYDSPQYIILELIINPQQSPSRPGDFSFGSTQIKTTILH